MQLRTSTLAAIPSIFGQVAPPPQAPAQTLGPDSAPMRGPSVAPSFNPGAPRQSRFGLGGYGSISDLKPHLKALKDQIAPQYLSKNLIEGVYFAGDNLGLTTKEIEDEESQEKLAARAHQFVQENAHLSDDAFQAAKAQLLMELGMETEAEQVGLNQPNDLQRGASGLMALLYPDQAPQMLAAPYAYELSERDRKQKEALDRIESSRKVRADRFNSLIDLARLENERNIAGIRAQSAAEVAGIRADSQQNIAAVNQALRQMGLDLQRMGLQLEERELNEVKIPQSQSRIATDAKRRQEIDARIKHYGQMDAESKARIERIATGKGLDQARTALLMKEVAYFDMEKRADIGLTLTRKAALEDLMNFRWADLSQEKQLSTMRIYGETLNDLLDSYNSQITAVNGIMDDLMNAVQDDRFLNNGQLSPEGQRFAQQFNELREMVYGDGGLRSKAKEYQQDLNDFASRVNRANMGQTQYRRNADGTYVPSQPQGGGKGTTYQRGADGIFRPSAPSRSGAAGTRNSRGGRINPAPAVQAARKAGFSGEGLVTAVAIAMAESRGNPSARNDNADTGDDSWGLWQINYFGNLAEGRTKKFGPKESMTDPVANAKAAYEISGGGRNFKAWTTYTSGKYKQYLQAARDAVAASEGR